MAELRADQLVCVDETFFNKRSGWKRAVYALIGYDGYYHHDVRIGKTWSILPAYTVDGYFSGVDIKKKTIQRRTILLMGS